MSIASDPLQDLTTVELAQILAARLTISPNEWHRLKANRNAQASQQLASALVFLLKNNQSEALERINQAQGWLDKSIDPLPCPTHHS
jgi:Family of unknown function (DUF6439)